MKPSAASLALLAAMAASSVHAADLPDTPGEKDIAFIGEVLALRRIEHSCDEEKTTPDAPATQDDIVADAKAPTSTDDVQELETVCMTVNAHYAVRLRALEAITGQPPDGEFEVQVATHYGAGWALARTALVVMAYEDGEPWLGRDLGIPVFRTVDGAWATCGTPFPRSPKDGPSPVPLRFADDVVFDHAAVHSDWVLAEDYPAPLYAIEDGRVRCTQGVRVEALLSDLEAKGEIELAPARGARR